MCVAEYMIPRVILRLIQHLRINSIPSNAQMDKEAQWSQCEQVSSNSRMKIIATKYTWFKIINDGFFSLKLQVILRADPFLKLLHDFSSLGSAMRTVMTKCLIDPMTYQRYVNININFDYCTL